MANCNCTGPLTPHLHSITRPCTCIYDQLTVNGTCTGFTTKSVFGKAFSCFFTAISMARKASKRFIFSTYFIFFLERARSRTVLSLASKARRQEDFSGRKLANLKVLVAQRVVVMKKKSTGPLSGLVLPTTFRHHYTKLCTDPYYMLSSSISSRIVIYPFERTSVATFYTFSSVFEVEGCSSFLIDSFPFLNHSYHQ